jgi:hypothetical protein
MGDAVAGLRWLRLGGVAGFRSLRLCRVTTRGTVVMAATVAAVSTTMAAVAT